jgi:hypothetical protein
VTHRRSKWPIVAGVAAIVVLAVLGSVRYALIAPHPKTGAVTGQVVDQNGPVPRARVIVSFWDWHLNPISDTSPHDIGLEADDKGMFSVEHDFDFRIGQIHVSACSPANELGGTQVREPRDSKEAVIVTVGRRVDNPERENYQYEYFRTHGSKMLFKGRGWPPPPNDSYFDN